MGCGSSPRAAGATSRLGPPPTGRCRTRKWTLAASRSTARAAPGAGTPLGPVTTDRSWAGSTAGEGAAGSAPVLRGARAGCARGVLHLHTVAAARADTPGQRGPDALRSRPRGRRPHDGCGRRAGGGGTDRLGRQRLHSAGGRDHGPEGTADSLERGNRHAAAGVGGERVRTALLAVPHLRPGGRDRKSTRLNSSHQIISYAVFCLKK